MDVFETSRAERAARMAAAEKRPKPKEPGGNDGVFVNASRKVMALAFGHSGDAPNGWTFIAGVTADVGETVTER